MAALTFPDIPPHRESPGKKTDYRVLESAFNDGYEQVSADGINNIVTTWDLVWTNEDKEDVQEIVDFLDQHAGSTPFYWTAPGEDTPRLWRCPGHSVKPVGEVGATLTATFKIWFGGEP